MLCSKILVILSTCLILQVQGKALPCNYQDHQSEAKSVLSDLEKIVSAVVEIATEAINGLETSLTAIQKFTVNVATDLVYQLGDDIFEKLDELKKDAYTVGVDIIDCLDDREDDLKQVPVVFVNRTSECAVERINEVMDSFAAIVLDIQSANEVLKNLTDKFERCGDDIECLDKIMEEIEEAAAAIPDLVKDDIKEAQQKIDDLLDRLFECEHDNYNQMQITAQEIFNGIAECVENKLANHSTTTNSL